MGLFTKPEVVVLRESTDAREYLAKLESILPRAQGEVLDKIEKEIAITKAGIFGEDNIMFELRNSNMDMIVLHDIYIETVDGNSAQIDFVVVTPKITFVIECKNLYGNIEINSSGDFIRTIQFGRKKYKEGIYSPITQNERHMNVIKQCRMEDKSFLMRAAFQSSFNSFYKSLIVLANPKTVVNDRYAKKEVKSQVLRADQLIATIKRMCNESNEFSCSRREMNDIALSLLNRNIDLRKDYSKKFEEMINEIDSQENKQSKNFGNSDTKKISDTNDVSKSDINNGDKKLICPQCGSYLTLRTAKKGNNIGKQFYGCPNFPKCRFVMNIE